jgi:predicted ATP-grasp superfamily ATP-dependent carboligase
MEADGAALIPTNWVPAGTRPPAGAESRVRPRRARGALVLPVKPSRDNVDVLLLDAENRQALAAMRVLARAGLTVGAVTCEADAWWSPSAQSRYCAAHAVVPNLICDAPAYVQAILQLLDKQQARMVIPMGDGTIHALRLRRAEIEQHSALALASESALDIAVSKSRTQALATELGISVPRTVQLTGCGDVAAALKEVGLPAVIKPVESWVERDGIGARLSAEVAVTADEAARILDGLFSKGGRALVQEWLPGRREAISLFYAQGRFWARMAQLSYREWPGLGGVSVLCETIPLPADIVADAERLVRAIDLDGCSMVEFRRDRHGRPILMEVNPRLAGSVALAISAGVNLPQLMVDWKLGRALREQVSYRVGRRLRWLAGDIWSLKGVFEHQGRPDEPPWLAAAATFVADFLRPTQVDGLELGDIRPILAEMNKFVLGHGIRRARRLFLPDPSRLSGR